MRLKSMRLQRIFDPRSSVEYPRRALLQQIVSQKCSRIRSRVSLRRIAQGCVVLRVSWSQKRSEPLFRSILFLLVFCAFVVLA